MEHNLNALRLVTEVELVYKSKVKASERPKISGSRDAYEIILAASDENTIELQEQFKVLLLNQASRVLGIYHVSTGGVTCAIADPRLIYVAALKAQATGIILCHNHPSGNLQPSKDDLITTEKIRLGGELLQIKVLDHLIVTPEGYYSFSDEGLL